MSKFLPGLTLATCPITFGLMFVCWKTRKAHPAHLHLAAGPILLQTATAVSSLLTTCLATAWFISKKSKTSGKILTTLLCTTPPSWDWKAHKSVILNPASGTYPLPECLEVVGELDLKSYSQSEWQKWFPGFSFQVQTLGSPDRTFSKNERTLIYFPRWYQRATLQYLGDSNDLKVRLSTGFTNFLQLSFKRVEGLILHSQTEAQLEKELVVVRDRTIFEKQLKAEPRCSVIEVQGNRVTIHGGTPYYGPMEVFDSYCPPPFPDPLGLKAEYDGEKQMIAVSEEGIDVWKYTQVVQPIKEKDCNGIRVSVNPQRCKISKNKFKSNLYEISCRSEQFETGIFFIRVE